MSEQRDECEHCWRELVACRAALAATEMRAIESEKDAAAFLRSRDAAMARAERAEAALVNVIDSAYTAELQAGVLDEAQALVAEIRARAEPK